ncbi:MAG TPA: hypothetical protein VKD90_02200 [Gemmataceae bacterium]|nr:hypothetical protein [Gemmataceae bacterium]
MRATTILTATFAAVLAGCQDRPPAGVAGGVSGSVSGSVSVTGTVTHTPYTREKFRELVIGKTPDEVIAAVGKPDRTVESGTAVFWYYDARTTNPATGKTDKKAQVVIRYGKAAEINY